MKGRGLKVTVETPDCLYCKKSSFIEMTRAEFLDLSTGMPLNQALPDWSLDKREMLITGTHPICWDIMFSEMDEDDEEVG